MTYQQAGRIAVLKRILGWVIFIPALISTLISLLKFMNTRQENQEGINAVMLDFTHVMIDMMQANTPFLNLFWYNSPTPNFNGGVNVMFWVISVSYTHLRAHETDSYLVCRLLLEHPFGG